MSGNVGLAFGMVTIAGLCTAVGACLVLCGNIVAVANKTFLAGALGLSAGVMLYVTFIEIFQKSLQGFHDAGVSGDNTSGLVYVSATLCFFGGILMMMALDKLVHWLSPGGNVGHDDFQLNPGADTNKKKVSREQELPDSLVHLTEGCCANKSCQDSEDNKDNVESGTTKTTTTTMASGGGDVENPGASTASKGASTGASTGEPLESKDDKLTRMGMMTALAIGLHNFPEGIATFVATLEDPSVGAALAVAIGIHNIPEGLCVSIPIYYATGSRWRALGWALLSGLSEPIGALLAYLILKDHFGPMTFGLVFGFVGGMMAYICLHELIPTAHRYDPEDRVTTISIIVGMAIMATSLVLFVLDPNPPAGCGDKSSNATALQ